MRYHFNYARDTSEIDIAHLIRCLPRTHHLYLPFKIPDRAPLIIPFLVHNYPLLPPYNTSPIPYIKIMSLNENTTTRAYGFFSSENSAIITRAPAVPRIWRGIRFIHRHRDKAKVHAHTRPRAMNILRIYSASPYYRFYERSYIVALLSLSLSNPRVCVPSSIVKGGRICARESYKTAKRRQ